MRVIFVDVAGPSLPAELAGHEMVRVGYDLIVLGGATNEILSGSIFKLSCANQSCQWVTLEQELKTPRIYFVAVAVPNDFLQCN